ncbi:JM147 [macacine gammaherpesvirus 11]|uniref:JM147 n=2 Tax=macacine gammaherpesvirus 11 TaxID=2560570 RepID=G9JMF3_9GAMA|nr:JM147 [Macaca fuscata rhadinovirus]AAT00123.1 JM147 [Macaca fuscata rhadinovirus]AEW87670.1 JM147 [Macaca fuscata rhadinovirus]AEW87840.1 JM147 [Macaca fuscata rhadinovirus]
MGNPRIDRSHSKHVGFTLFGESPLAGPNVPARCTWVLRNAKLPLPCRVPYSCSAIFEYTALHGWRAVGRWCANQKLMIHLLVLWLHNNTMLLILGGCFGLYKGRRKHR